MNRASKLAVAAAIAASIPLAASAGDVVHRPVPAPAPVASTARIARPVRPPTPPTWHALELAKLRAEFRALDAERTRFYAQPGVRRGQARKFEEYYAARRAELERRWEKLQYVAMR
jgi:hypothetical protein